MNAENFIKKAIYSNLHYINSLGYVFDLESPEDARAYFSLSSLKHFTGWADVLYAYSEGCRMILRLDRHYRITLKDEVRTQMDKALDNISKVIKSLKEIRITAHYPDPQIHICIDPYLELSMEKYVIKGIECNSFLRMLFIDLDEARIGNSEYINRIFLKYEDKLGELCREIELKVENLDSIPRDLSISQHKYDDNSQYATDTERVVSEALSLSELLMSKFLVTENKDSYENKI